jgi:hexulose-6-phosphate isomerase
MGASTVPLGTGDADFPALEESLKKVAYKGDFILQVARGASGDEVAWARQNREFVLNHFCQAR